MSEEKPLTLMLADRLESGPYLDDCRIAAARLRRLHSEVERLKSHAPVAHPIDMVLHCPACGLQHVDAPMTDSQYTERLHESSWWECGGDKPGRWTNPPHRSHLCHGCGHIWRPADVPTNGVQAVKTKGKADSPIAAPAPVAQGARNVPFRPETWELDADGDPPVLCTECGRPVRYGSRHVACAALAPAPVAPADPLTDAQLDALDTFALATMAPRGRESVRQYARAIERAHGITGGAP
jgi:hypothetical protein